MKKTCRRASAGPADLGVERDIDAAAADEVDRAVERHIMAFVHSGAAAAGEDGHVDEAHDCSAVDRSAMVEHRFGRKDATARAAFALWPE